MQIKDQESFKKHRYDMIEQFLKYGFQVFSEQEKLEFMLNFPATRGGMDELAARLLEECGGTMASVFDTSPRKIRSIKGVTPNISAYLVFLPQMAAYYMSRKYVKGDRFLGNKTRSVAKYFEGVFLCIMHEEIHAAALTDDMRIIREKKIADGTLGSVGFSPRMLLDFAFECESDHLIIAHNHPRSVCWPSSEDIHATGELVELLDSFDVHIEDHIVVGVDGSQSLRALELTDRIWNTGYSGGTFSFDQKSFQTERFILE